MDKMPSKKHLIMVFYGVSGSGKSLLLKMMKDIFPNVTLHRKDSTRPRRQGEPAHGTPELRLVKKLGPASDYLLTYQAYGAWFGVRKDQLNKSFDKSEIHLIIIANIKAIKEFKAFYPHAITVYVHSDPQNIPERLIKRDTLEYEKRKKRSVALYKGFLNNNTLFDFIVLNFWDKRNAAQQAENIIKKYYKSFEKLSL